MCPFEGGLLKILLLNNIQTQKHSKSLYDSITDWYHEIIRCEYIMDGDK